MQELQEKDKLIRELQEKDELVRELNYEMTANFENMSIELLEKDGLIRYLRLQVEIRAGKIKDLKKRLNDSTSLSSDDDFESFE